MSVTPSLGVRFMDRLQHHNPFYFLSAACMLGGILAVTNSLSWIDIPIGRLLTLILLLNIYEAALIGLAVYLVRRRNLARDGVMLLALEAFFLIDITFLSAEIATSHPVLGLIINLLLFFAAIIKLAVISDLLGQGIGDGKLAVIVLQLAALFALPIFFRWMDQGDLSPRMFYAAWWGIGLIIPLSQAMMRSPGFGPATGWARKTMLLYLALPWLSLVMHLGNLHYVYGVQYYGPDAAPILLGLAFLLNRAAPNRLTPRTDLAILKTLLPAAAILVSLDNPQQLCLTIGKHGSLLITPTRLAMAAAYISYVHFFARSFQIQLFIAGAAGALLWIYGPTADQINRSIEKYCDWACDIADRIMPSTTQGWGAASIVAAFAFLGIGVRLSLRRRPPQPPPLPSPEPTPTLEGAS